MIRLALASLGLPTISATFSHATSIQLRNTSLRAGTNLARGLPWCHAAQNMTSLSLDEAPTKQQAWNSCHFLSFHSPLQLPSHLQAKRRVALLERQKKNTVDAASRGAARRSALRPRLCRSLPLRLWGRGPRLRPRTDSDGRRVNGLGPRSASDLLVGSKLVLDMFFCSETWKINVIGISSTNRSRKTTLSGDEPGVALSMEISQDLARLARRARSPWSAT